jgi:hypothetical protein
MRPKKLARTSYADNPKALAAFWPDISFDAERSCAIAEVLNYVWIGVHKARAVSDRAITDNVT